MPPKKIIQKESLPTKIRDEISSTVTLNCKMGMAHKKIVVPVAPKKILSKSLRCCVCKNGFSEDTLQKFQKLADQGKLITGLLVCCHCSKAAKNKPIIAKPSSSKESSLNGGEKKETKLNFIAITPKLEQDEEMQKGEQNKVAIHQKKLLSNEKHPMQQKTNVTGTKEEKKKENPGADLLRQISKKLQEPQKQATAQRASNTVNTASNHTVGLKQDYSYICGNCGKGFNMVVNLQVHMLKHTRELMTMTANRPIVRSNVLGHHGLGRNQVQAEEMEVADVVNILDPKRLNELVVAKEVAKKVEKKVELCMGQSKVTVEENEEISIVQSKVKVEEKEEICIVQPEVKVEEEKEICMRQSEVKVKVEPDEVHQEVEEETEIDLEQDLIDSMDLGQAQLVEVKLEPGLVEELEKGVKLEQMAELVIEPELKQVMESEVEQNIESEEEPEIEKGVEQDADQDDEQDEEEETIDEDDMEYEVSTESEFSSEEEQKKKPKQKATKKKTVKQKNPVETGLFKCKICHKSFKRKSSILLHMNIHSGDEMFVCGFCGRRFLKKTSLAYHMNSHAKDINLPFSGAPHICSVCGMGYVDKKSLLEHAISVHGELSLIKCRVCGQLFTDQDELTEHMTVHTKAEVRTKGACHICGKAFKRPYYLLQHLRTHKGERPYSCVICGKGFSQQANLATHFKSHSNSRPFNCETCGKGFKLYQDLNRHVQIHSGKRPFVCAVCGATFKRKDQLARHMKIHACNLCGLQFGKRRELFAHMKSHTQ